jgi:hypothetical protein
MMLATVELMGVDREAQTGFGATAFSSREAQTWDIEDTV